MPVIRTILACAATAICMAATDVCAENRPVSASNAGQSAARPSAPTSGAIVAPDSWHAYRDRFIQPDGRLTDIDNGGISHSEGQGYGMLLAVLADDRPTFDRMWRWTALNLFVRNDNLAAWRWRSREPHISDRNNATDGDLLIAWALSRAARTWRSADYRAASRRIALAVSKLIDSSSTGAPTLPPASFGFGRGQMPDGPVINLSYAVFPAFDELKSVAPEVDWGALRKSFASLVEQSRFGPDNLPADWESLSSGKPAPAQFQAPVFGYEAIRIPLYLAWSSASDRQTLGVFASSWQGKKGDDPGVVDLLTGRAKQSFQDAGYRSIVALTRCAANGEMAPESLMRVDLSRYYPATLHMLSLAALREKYPACLPVAATAQR